MTRWGLPRSDHTMRGRRETLSASGHASRTAREKFTFGTLKQAQALGDFESLANRHRRAIRVDLGRDVEKGLRRLLALVKAAMVQPAEVGADK